MAGLGTRICGPQSGPNDRNPPWRFAWIAAPGAAADVVDRTPKMYVGGKQARPDGGYSRAVVGPKGRCPGDMSGTANRKDVRNAVEAATAASKGWAGTTGASARAQILFYFLAENLAARRG